MKQAYLKTQLLTFFFICILTSCNQRLPDVVSRGGSPAIFPDYTDVTIPVNIAPLNFRIDKEVPAIAILSFKNKELKIKTNNGSFKIPIKAWKRLLKQAAGQTLQVSVYEKMQNGWHCYNTFPVHVANETIDPYLIYRRIAPGYRMWSEMGIYQRNLEKFDETAILNNKQTHNNCMNCHSICMQAPEQLLFHQRSQHAGTYLVSKNNISTIRPVAVLGKKTEKTPPLTYPYWHPSGKFIAFSSNHTKQDFHHSDPNRIEVFDSASDIYIYDMKTQELLTTPLLSSDENMETFPSFSPDGKSLYLCSAPSEPMPESYQNIKYNLLRISFDPETRSFGTIPDTLYNANQQGRSAKFPRVSPDGSYLMYTLSDYGNFSIWHNDADLFLIDMKTLETNPLSNVNSSDVDSYHSWSSNSRWFVFSSRRMDGLYTRPYICYIKENGTTGKPFLLPQKETDYYTYSLFSFNIPELAKGRIEVSSYDLIRFTQKQMITNSNADGYSNSNQQRN